MLRHNSVQTTEQAKGTLLPPRILRLVYLLYKLPNRSKGLSPSGILRFAARATKQAKGTFTLWHFTACSIAKHQIGQTDFYPLTLDGSTIRNQLRLGDDQGLGRRLMYTPRWFDLQAL